MKKLLMVSLLIGSVLLFGVATQAYALLVTVDLVATYGVVQALPIAAPVIIDVKDAGGALLTQGEVDFAVLLSGGVYSYFYQVKNIGGGAAYPLSRFSLADPFSYPLLGSGVMGADLGDPVVLTTAFLTNLGANLDAGGDLLASGQTTKRFYFQFSGVPGLVSGSLMDGGSVGSKLVVGPVPEPASLLLLGSGLLGLAAFGSLRRRKA